MKTEFGHLTYCTNIHPGESWVDHFQELRIHLPLIKKEISPNQPMGIGLRLSNEASLSLIEENQLLEFQNWLEQESFYVIGINGFPYGGFHTDVVKEAVYQPDWSDQNRIEYTQRLFFILKELLPANEEGGVSTVPLSYLYFDTNVNDRNVRKSKSTEQIIQTLLTLIRIQKATGKTLHLDIEPEPDGMLGCFLDWVIWYTSDLLPAAFPVLMDEFGFDSQFAEEQTKNHIRLCLDVCHLAVTYEVNPFLFSELKRLGIKVGRIQVSSALKVKFQENVGELLHSLKPFDEKKYLHQVVAITKDGEKRSYRDLNLALDAGANRLDEWRIHFHVPIFLETYGTFLSTQEELKLVLTEHKKDHLSHILEVETYTWNVLPKNSQLPIDKSIIRELQWLRSFLESNSQI
ncbi:metabolite traffic protein EboE [Leptospira jelokensis]|uniref:metabolite traffic protein EboE n=1 Tax=Leptospira jelokensis TaxID=2484931 RepID=UPI001090FFED|nr:metabolite traffic protein EboE [Leptospira jelokensis]TGM05065.1 xylose isomerase [Leptospira jelokensis]